MLPGAASLLSDNYPDDGFIYHFTGIPISAAILCAMPCSAAIDLCVIRVVNDFQIGAVTRG